MRGGEVETKNLRFAAETGKEEGAVEDSAEETVEGGTVGQHRGARRDESRLFFRIGGEAEGGEEVPRLPIPR